MFYETKKNPKPIFRVLSCVIYTMIKKYVCIDNLGSESKKLGELGPSSCGGNNHEGEVMTKYWVLEFQIC